MRVFCGGHPSSAWTDWHVGRQAPEAIPVRPENVAHWDGYVLVGPYEPYGSGYVDSDGQHRTHGPRLTENEVAVCKCPGNGYNTADYYVFARGETVPAAVIDQLISWRSAWGLKTVGLREQLAEIVSI